MRTLLLISLFAGCVLAQEKQRLVGEIEFFGYTGIDIKKLKDGLPLREGDKFKVEKKGELTSIKQKTEEAIQKTLGHSATEFSPVCCDKQGNWMIYIGLSGNIPRYHPQPKGDVRLPQQCLDLYKRFETELKDAILRGVAQEDQSQGYALSMDASLRKTQLEMREYALKHEALLCDVLVNASDHQHRIVAAEILGYAQQSKQQITSLVHAAKDADGTVRNNATRALWILVDSNPKLAMDIPEEFFIDLLLSGKWTDVNKACLLLCSLTEGKDKGATILARLRSNEARERLIEIARWKTFHADCARYLLGRMAGIDEDRLKLLVTSGQTEEIVKDLIP
jgi:hypothetical protein